MLKKGSKEVLDFITSSLLFSGNKNISHVFFTRNLGVSRDVCSSLNGDINSCDNPGNLKKKLDIIASSFQLQSENLKLLKQIHSTKVIYIDDSNKKDFGEGDGLVTDIPGVIIAVRTADCVPILFLDADNMIIGASHAGWRGAFSGIIENTIEAMIGLGAKKESIVAAIGPCIRQENYEVGVSFYQNFISSKPYSKKFFKFINEKIFFDLPGHCMQILKLSGIKNYEDIGLDTYSNPSNFFSYRRSTHENQGNKPITGTQISAITISLAADLK